MHTHALYVTGAPCPPKSESGTSTPSSHSRQRGNPVAFARSPWLIRPPLPRYVALTVRRPRDAGCGGGLGARLHLPTPIFVAVEDRLARLLHVVGDDQALEVARRDLPFDQQRALDPIQQPLPVRAPEQDHREVLDLPRLDQRERLEQLVQRAEAAREDDKSLRVLDEHRLAHEEVAEVERDVD